MIYQLELDLGTHGARLTVTDPGGLRLGGDYCTLGISVTVAQLTLDQLVKVRILDPQLNVNARKTKTYGRFCLNRVLGETPISWRNTGATFKTDLIFAEQIFPRP